jgi:hypothetical protein
VPDIVRGIEPGGVSTLVGVLILAPGVEPRSLFADRLTFRSYERIVGASFSLKGLRTVNRSSTT